MNSALSNSLSIQRRHSSFEPIRTKRSVIRRKTLACPKIPQKTKTLQKLVRGALFGIFAADARSFQVEKLFPKKLMTFSEDP